MQLCKSRAANYGITLGIESAFIVLKKWLEGDLGDVKQGCNRFLVYSLWWFQGGHVHVTRNHPHNREQHAAVCIFR
jgi:hypothetical protein